MSDPLPGTSTSGAQQPQESRHNQCSSEASVSGKRVAAKHQDKHLACEHTDITPSKARTAKIVQPVYSKMGTELSSPSNPFAMHYLPVESGNFIDHRARLNSVSLETLEPNNVRLQIKILKKAIMIVEKKMADAMQGSARNLSKLFDSIQDCYHKCWCLNRLFQQWQFPPPDINIDQVNQLITNFENRCVHFLMVCRPPFADQRQDLLFMCVWYLSCKDVRGERDTANFLHICRRSALLFLAAPFKALDQAMATQRLTKPAKGNVSTSCEDLSRIIFFHLAKLSVPGCTYSIHSERIVANIKQQLHSDPLFQGDRKETQFDPALAELDEHLATLSALNALDEIPPPLPGQTTPYQFSQAKFVIKNIGFSPYQPSSPAMALTVLEQIYRYIRLPDVREDVENYSRMFSQRIDTYNQSLYALLRFLAGDRDDTNIRLIINDDLQYFLKALTHYLKAQWPEAEKLAAKSQWPEAIWLLGQLCYRRGDLAGSISHIQKAVDQGVDSALLQLANLLLKSPSPDLERVDNLLSEATDYHRITCSDTVAMRIYHMTMQLELARGWEEDELFTAPATGKSKAKGKGKKRRPLQPSQHLSQRRLAQVNLLCIEAMSNHDYDWALQLLVDASQKVSCDFQRASLANMDLWRLTEINCNVDYLHRLHHLAVTEDPSLTIATLRQDSELIRTQGLNQNNPVALTDSMATIRENTGNWIIKQSLGWLCLLHQTPEEPWRQTPKAQARQQLDNFEHSPALTFITAMLLTTMASVFKEKSEACNDPDQASDYHGQSLQFFEAAGEFHNWQNLLNSNGRLKARIEAATGSSHRQPKTQPKASESEKLNFADRSTEKPEQQPRSDQDDTDKAVERVVIDMVNHAAGDTGDENERTERPERDSNTTVV